MADKYMNVYAFIDAGYLQELNRRFLHPLGLALEFTLMGDEDMHPTVGIVDYREDEEGIIFDQVDARNIEKARDITAIWHMRAEKREKALGYVIQPMPE